jgi:hypothetical protein
MYFLLFLKPFYLANVLHLCMHYRKKGTILIFFIILGTKEYNGSIFLSTETEECMVNR